MGDTNGDARMDVDGPQPGPSGASSRQPVARASSLPPFLNASKTTVGYVYSTLMMTHTNTRGHHEEQPDRISRIFNLLKDSDCLTKMRRLPIRPVAREEALLVHSEALWEKIMAIQCRRPFTMQTVYRLLRLVQLCPKRISLTLLPTTTSFLFMYTQRHPTVRN